MKIIKWIKDNAGQTLFILGVIFLLIHFIRQDSAVKLELESLRGVIDSRIDSLMANQATYERLIKESNERISASQGEVRIIEKERPKIYYNYIETVSNYKADSTINPYFERDSIDFCNRLYSGWFFRP